MKKALFLLTIFICNYCNAQISISGATPSGLNTTLTFGASSAFWSACATGITPADAGTNIYVVTDPLSGTALRYTIVRRGGYWHIEGHYGGGAYLVYYKLPTISTDPNPPCSAIWNVYTGNCYYTNGITNTGTSTTLTLGGSCSSSVPSISTTVYPNIISLPQLTTIQINSIVTPMKGMITFDINTNTIKVYNGASWLNLSTF